MKFKRWIEQSEAEYKKYLKTRKIEHLAEAGEKLWNAYRYLIAYLSGKKGFANSRELNKETKRILHILHKEGLEEERYRLGRLSDQAFTLHILFYNFNLDTLSQNPYREALSNIKYLSKRAGELRKTVKGELR